MTQDAQQTNQINDPQRRKLFRQAFRYAGVAVVGSVIGHALLRSRPAISAEIIRPPGALPEKQFDATCIRCGLCVEDCPYDILKLASWNDEAPTGTPFLLPVRIRAGCALIFPAPEPVQLARWIHCSPISAKPIWVWRYWSAMKPVSITKV